MIDFRRLRVWSRAHTLAIALMNDSRLDESARASVVGLQMRRTALSIAANIAEGAGSASHAQFSRYLGVALASAFELDYFVVAARDSEIWPLQHFDACCSRSERESPTIRARNPGARALANGQRSAS